MNGDELKLRVVPEVDDDAIRKAQAELDKLQSRPTAGPKSGVDDALKAELAGIKATIDANDLKLRKFLANSAEEEKAIRRKQALDQLTTKQAQDLIAQETQARENMIAETVAGYQTLEAQLASYDQANQQVINRQKQLFYASERAKTGFSSMSRSMGGLTESTKDANIAFANFGRIVQDAPFGLLGISNNIDPMLVSFARLKESVGGTGLALRALGAQLLGPAGLIFLLGSALPTALLFLQRAMRDGKKDANELEEALKGVNKSAINLIADAAAKWGSDSIAREIQLADFALEDLNKEIERFSRQAAGGGIESKRLLEAAQAEKAFVEQLRQGLELRFQTAKAEERIQDLVKSGRVGEALASQRRGEQYTREQEEAKKRSDALEREQKRRAEQRERLEMGLSKFLDDELRHRIKQEQAAVRELLNNETITREEKIALQVYYDNIEARLTQEAADEKARIEAEALRKRLEQEKKFFDEKAKLAARKQWEAERREMATQDMFLRFAQLSNNQRLAIDRDFAIQEYDIVKNAAQLGLTNEQELADALLSLKRQKWLATRQLEIEQSAIVASAGLAVAEAIFGESRGIASAFVALEATEAAFTAYANTSKLAPFPVGNALGLAAAAAVVAKGVTAIRNINKKTIRNSKPDGVDASGPSAKGLPFVSDRPFLATPLATSIGATMLPSNVTPINVEARIDRMGLAVAVRQGESDIATRQIPFAS
jgi:hypothetical protein